MPQEARAETLGSGFPRALDRVDWAVTHVARAGFIDKIARGIYQISEKGHQWLRDHPEGLSTYSEANRLFAEYWPDSKSGSTGNQGDNELLSEAIGAEPSQSGPELSGVEVAPGVPQENPVELIEAGVDEIKASVADDLLKRLRESHPDFFEEAVVSLLLAMGYGGAEQRGKRIGGTGDGGVDGLIEQDALGLDQIYIQAKRYAETNTVGRPTVQEFVGALHGKQASRGVFITTSTFTKAAREYADGINNLRVILIDGDRLGKLMVKYKVGIQVEHVYEVVKVDEDFFE